MKEKMNKAGKSIHQDDEIMKILKAAESQMPEELTLFKEIEKGKVIPRIPDTQDPELAHKLYYGFYRRLLTKYLPKGEEYKKARKLIRDEANLFLKDGKTTGRDSRQAYTFMMQEAVNTIIDWYNETKGTNLSELYNRFKDNNEKRLVLNKK